MSFRATATAFSRARDDYDLCRELINLRGTRTVRFCDFAPDDFRDLVLFAPLARNDRPPPFRDLVRVLPIAAPVTAPTVCFGIWRNLDIFRRSGAFPSFLALNVQA
jgi:hypothetical protein